MDTNFNEPLYRKILLLMIIDRGYEADFFERYVDQSVFDELLKQANAGTPDVEYMKRTIQQQMDGLINELRSSAQTNLEDLSLSEGLEIGLKQALAYKRGEDAAASQTTVSLKPLPSYTKEQLKSIRNQLGLTQKKFAELLGVSHKTIEAWESGSNPPSGTALRLLQLLQENHSLPSALFDTSD